MNRYGVLIDTTYCVDCHECDRVCAERWGFPITEDRQLSSTKNTAIFEINDRYVPRGCMHCANPACASACPVGAFHVTPTGAVVYDVNKCIGCRYCMQACPFDVPKYQWDSRNPKVTKCDMCYDLTAHGEPPRCAAACPTEARMFGQLDDLIAEAKRRIQENPDTYYPHIFGLKEVGGTSIIYISDKPMTELGFRANLPGHALPELTWAVVSKIPNYVFWSGTLLAGIYWITNRRKEVQAFERKLKQMEETNPSTQNRQPGRSNNGE